MIRSSVVSSPRPPLPGVAPMLRLPLAAALDWNAISVVLLKTSLRRADAPMKPGGRPCPRHGRLTAKCTIEGGYDEDGLSATGRRCHSGGEFDVRGRSPCAASDHR